MSLFPRGQCLLAISHQCESTNRDTGRSRRFRQPARGAAKPSSLYLFGAGAGNSGECLAKHSSVKTNSTCQPEQVYIRKIDRSTRNLFSINRINVFYARLIYLAFIIPIQDQNNLLVLELSLVSNHIYILIPILNRL